MPSDTAASTRTRTAVVIGASIGGLMAARALSDRFDRVLLVERDRLDDDTLPRKGVPQGRHAHGLLAGGLRALERQFPGFARDLEAEGAVGGDIQGESLWHGNGVTLKAAPSDLHGYLMSRGLIERTIRRRVAALPAVSILTGRSVDGLRHVAGRVTGVRLSSGETLAADLVVDASGRGSRSAAWLVAAGYAEPAAETIEIGITYTTRIFRRRPGDFDGRSAVVIGVAPGNWRYGVALALEGDRMIVTMGGYFGDEAPTDDTGFRAFGESLDSPEIGRWLATAEPLSDATVFRYPASVRRRWERMKRLPAGFIAFGDALCSFNPVYGQGMSSAALQAEALAAALTGPEETLATRFHRAAAAVVDAPWQIAAGADFGHPRLKPAAPFLTRAMNAYIARLYRTAAADADVGYAFLRVANLLAAPPAIFAPKVLAKVLFGAPPARTKTAAPTNAGRPLQV